LASICKIAVLKLLSLAKNRKIVNLNSGEETIHTMPGFFHALSGILVKQQK